MIRDTEMRGIGEGTRTAEAQTGEGATRLWGPKRTNTNARETGADRSYVDRGSTVEVH